MNIKGLNGICSFGWPFALETFNAPGYSNIHYKPSFFVKILSYHVLAANITHKLGARGIGATPYSFCIMELKWFPTPSENTYQNEKFYSNNLLDDNKGPTIYLLVDPHASDVYGSVYWDRVFLYWTRLHQTASDFSVMILKKQHVWMSF